MEGGLGRGWVNLYFIDKQRLNEIDSKRRDSCRRLLNSITRFILTMATRRSWARTLADKGAADFYSERRLVYTSGPRRAVRNGPGSLSSGIGSVQIIGLLGRLLYARTSSQSDQGRPPWISSRLQDFFGMKETPRIGPDRTPLVIHLLAPNHRAVQTTTDLAGFWERLYPQVRRELIRRYPKHAWPERPQVQQDATKS